MKITIKRTDEQVELIKAMASKNREVAFAAQLSLAEFIGPVLAEVINNAPTISNMFTTLQYNADDNPSIPLDLYYDIFDEDYIKVYSQSVAGGLPTNYVQPTAAELKFTTYNLNSAVSFDKKYASRSRLDVVGKTFTRVAQEVLRKQERTSANLLLTAAANASTGNAVKGWQNRHIFRSNTANRFLLDDLNKLFTKAKRVNASFLGGTPSGARRGITDLLMSPEIVEQIRAMAYNPINTVAANGGATGQDSYGVTLTDAQRMSIFSQAGLTEFMGLNIIELNEMGIGKFFNDVFDTVAGSTDYQNHGVTNASGAFNGATEELVLAVDRSRDAMVRMVAIDSDTSSEFNLVPDDQFSSRQQKIGFYGDMEEGRVILDSRAILGLII